MQVANPTFIGFCASKEVPAGALVVPKAEPGEKVCSPRWPTAAYPHLALRVLTWSYVC